MQYGEGRHSSPKDSLEPIVIRRVRHYVLALAGLGFVACTVVIAPDELEDGVCPDGYKGCEDECVKLDLPDKGCAAKSCSPCVVDHAVAICSAAGTCTIAICNKGFTDCNGEANDGCEIETAFDKNNCGACGKPCVADTMKHVAEPGCSQGACVVGKCADGYVDCDHFVSSGCEHPESAGPCM